MKSTTRKSNNSRKSEVFITPNDLQNINLGRRKFLKILLFGAGVFLLGLLGKHFGPIANFLKGSGPKRNPKDSGPEMEKEFENWKVIEKKDVLIFRDKSGEEILILDWGNKDK